MPEVSKNALERPIAAVTTVSSLMGVAFGVVSVFDSTSKLFWGLSFFALGSTALASFCWLSRSFDQNKPGYVMTYHWVISTCMTVVSIGLFLWAGFVGFELLKEKEESGKLVVHVRQIEKHKVLAGGRWNEKVTIAKDIESFETIDVMPYRVYFELFKNPKTEFARVESVRIIVEKEDPLPNFRLEERIASHFVPTIKFTSNLSEKKKDEKDRWSADCNPIDRIDVDAVYLDDKLPHPFSVLIDSDKPGLFTVGCEVVISHRSKSNTISVGSIKLIKIVPPPVKVKALPLK